MPAKASRRAAPNSPGSGSGRRAGTRLNGARVSRPLRLLVFLLTVATVLAFGELHAHVVARHPYSFTGTSRFTWLVFYIAVILVASYAAGVFVARRTLASAALRSFLALGAAALIVSAVALFAGTQILPRFVVFGSAATLLPVWMLASSASTRSRRRREGLERILAVVSPDEGALLLHDLDVAPERHATVVAQCPPAELEGSAGAAELRNRCQATKATLLVLNRQVQADDLVMSEVARLHAGGVRVRTLSLFYDEWLGKLPISELERISLMFDINEIHQAAYSRTKRVIDVVLALAGLVPLVLAVPLVALLDLLGNRGPLFFRQPRVGKDGKVFTIVKFRSMLQTDGPATWTGEDDPRLRPVGRWLRRTHLDELPQVLNVLRRDLSIVGPRPEQPAYVAALGEKIPFYDVRHLVKPGITGWAQVKYPYGASDLDAWEKLQYEFYYLRHQSLSLDLRIIGRTIRSVVDRKGR
jgi:lipopolysaccharide/colanic/teichoic acid biosynthesis glycosyltransferase